MFNFIKKIAKKLHEWREYGTYRSTFTSFGNDAYRSEIVRACIRPLADFTSKAEAICNIPEIETLLKYNPNQLMSGSDFLYKIRTMYELQNTVFILIDRDSTKIYSFYPIPYTSYETLADDSGNLYIKFWLRNGDTLVASWDDLIVLRKDYNKSDISGDSNDPIINTLEMINTSNESITNAVKSTSNLRGILRYQTTGSLSSKDLKDKKDEFVKSYLSNDNASGVGILDKSMEFDPVELKPMTATWTQMKEFRENVFRYYGVNDKIVMSQMTPDEAQIFYEARIEPFLIALSKEMTRKVLTHGQLAKDGYIRFASSQIQFMSMQDKLNLKQYIDIGALLKNEWRDILNMGPVEGGDVPLLRLDTKENSNNSTSGKDEKNE